MNKTISLKKYLIVCAVGFGIGGFLWGLVLYSELPDLEFPFHFMAILIMGVFGGIALVGFSQGVRQVAKAVLAGFLGYGIGFVVVGVFSYPLSLISGFLLSIIIPSFLIDSGYIVLVPNIGITVYWLLFLIIGLIIGLFYALFLKTKKWPLIWRGGLGLALASLISPIIGNLIGNVFDSLLLAYLITFSLIGIILGLFLACGVYTRNKRSDLSI